MPNLLHLCHYSGNSGTNGMYNTVRDIINIERSLGYTVNLIDDAPDEESVNRYGEDGVTPVSDVMQAILEADLIFIHHTMPSTILSMNTAKVVIVLHGTPNYCYELERRDPEDCLLSIIIGSDKQLQNLRGFITLWKDHLPQWELLLNPDRRNPIKYVPSPVDLNFFKRNTERDRSNKICVGFLDSDRPTRESFNILLGVLSFYKAYAGEYEITFRIWSTAEYVNAKANLNIFQYFGSDLVINTRTKNPATDIYPLCDVIVTTSTEETRVVREAMACGIPVVFDRSSWIARKLNSLAVLGEPINVVGDGSALKLDKCLRSIADAKCEGYYNDYSKAIRDYVELNYGYSAVATELKTAIEGFRVSKILCLSPFNKDFIEDKEDRKIHYVANQDDYVLLPTENYELLITCCVPPSSKAKYTMLKGWDSQLEEWSQDYRLNAKAMLFLDKRSYQHIEKKTESTIYTELCSVKGSAYLKGISKCILVLSRRMMNEVTNSSLSYKNLFSKLREQTIYISTRHFIEPVANERLP